MHLKLLLFVCISIACLNGALSVKLVTQGQRFFYDGTQVYLSGANLPWLWYGYDFGDGHYGASGPELRAMVNEIEASGGNTFRLILHVEGTHTPVFGADGHVVSLDSAGTFITEVTQFLDYARDHHVFVVLVLWFGTAAASQQHFINLVNDDSILDSYIHNALTPLVTALVGHPALAAWEVANEPELSVTTAANPNPCYDTTTIGAGGIGGGPLSMERILRFIGRQNAAIRAADPNVLVGNAAASEISINDAFPNSVNHYSDACLQAASGVPNSHIDYYKMNTYAWLGAWAATAPFVVNANDYALTKPVVIGRFSFTCAAGETIPELWEYPYNNNFAGQLSWAYNGDGTWCMDTRAQQDQGMNHIRAFTHNGVIPIVLQ